MAKFRVYLSLPVIHDKRPTGQVWFKTPLSDVAAVDFGFL